MENKNENAKNKVQKIFNIGDRIYFLDDDRIVTGIIDVVITKKFKCMDLIRCSNKKNTIKTSYLYEVKNGDGKIRSDCAFASFDDLVKHLKENIVDFSDDSDDGDDENKTFIN